MSTKEPIYDESFEKANRLNKRLATINDYYLIIVTTRPFTEYLGDTRYGSLTEFVAADEKNDLMAFIDSYDGSEKKKIFHFKNALGEMRLNMLNLHANKQHIKTKEINIEMLDIESLYDTNQMLFDDIKRDQALFGLTKEYTFTYNVISDTFIIYRYDMFSKDTIYKMSLNQWKDFMIDEGFIADSDIDLFKNLVSQIMAYDQSFSAKITSSMRTHKQVMEKLVFTAGAPGRVSAAGGGDLGACKPGGLSARRCEGRRSHLPDDCRR